MNLDSPPPSIVNRNPFVLSQPGSDSTSQYTFRTPSKCIDSGDDLAFFLTSTTYHELKLWLLQLTRACLPVRSGDGKVETRQLGLPLQLPPTVASVQDLVKQLDALIEQAPPHTGPRRFGNVAFRTWSSLLEAKGDDLIDASLTRLLDEHGGGDTARRHALRDELKAYFLGGFGSAQRLDYGTGHELSFLAFLGCLWKLGAFQAGDEWSIVAGVVQPYLALVQKLIKTYTLEPAGSHGVWGLDDHFFVPYILGSAQIATPLEPPTMTTPFPPTPVEGSLESAPEPASIMSRPAVEEWEDRNFYFAAIAFILAVKKGPFFEHSPYLYNISGIRDGWGKINKGMLKMYDAEVLAKFPVVQHFPFGSLWPWERSQEAAAAAAAPRASVHATNQPNNQRGLNAAIGTQAPWVRSVGSSTGMAPPQRGGNTDGLPATRAPWAANGAGSRFAQPSTFEPSHSATSRPQMTPGRTLPPSRGPRPP